MKKLLMASAACFLLAGPVFAQSSSSSANLTNSSTSRSGSASIVSGSPVGNGASSSASRVQAATTSRSGASATSGVTSSRVGNTSATGGAVTVNVGTTAAGDPSSATGTTAAADPSSSDPSGDPTYNNNVHYSGGYTVRNVPEVVAPNIVGGNPCAIGASAGMAVAGFGITGGATWADRACERRQQTALLFNIGQKDAALALLCQDEHVAAAVNLAGPGCPAARPAAQAAPPSAITPAVVQSAAPALPPLVVLPNAGAVRPAYAIDPAPAPVHAPVPSPIVGAAASAVLPAWCDTVTGPYERARFAAECHFQQTANTDHRHRQRLATAGM